MERLCKECRKPLKNPEQIGNLCNPCAEKQSIRVLEDSKNAMLKNGLETMTKKEGLDRFEDNIRTIAFMGVINGEQTQELFDFIKKRAKV